MDLECFVHLRTHIWRSLREEKSRRASIERGSMRRGSRKQQPRRGNMKRIAEAYWRSPR